MTLWAKGLDFKNKANSTRVGGVGVYGQDGQAQKVYLGLGHEPWNNQGLEMTSSTIKFKGNDIYHVGRKPSPAEIGAVNKAGDTMTGNLVMASGKIIVGSHNYGFKCDTKEGSSDYVLYIDSDNKVHVGYNGRAMKLDSLDIVNKNNKKIYHEDNKPTPDEIGASGKGLCLDNRKAFIVGGDANKYYPVIIKAGELNSTGVYGLIKMSISRGYASKAPDSWNNSTHKGGLTFTILTSGDCYWGGNDQYIEVLRFDQTYSQMVAGMQLSTSGIVVWLRGGEATYYLTSDYGAASTVDVKLEGFTDSAKQVFQVRTNLDLVDSEIRSKYRLRYNGLYDGNSKVYSPNNKPTPNDIGAWSKIAIRLEGVNFNTITQGGCYATVRNSTANNSPTNQDGRLLVLSWNSNHWASQMFFADGGRIYTRTSTNTSGTSWTSWTELYTRQSKPTPSEIGAVSKSGDTINGNLTIANNGVLNAGNISLRGRDITINGKRALVGYSQDDGNLLIINFDKDYGAGVVIKGNVHVQQGALKADNGLDAKLNSIEIPAGHNLNDYQTPGMYYCPSDANASKIGNVPVGCAFSLLVEAHAGRKQTFTCYWKDNPKTYVRNFYMGQWGAWLIQCDGLTGPNGVSWVDKTNYWNKVPFVGSDGVMEVGKYIDFHNSDRDSKDFQVRLEAGTDGKLYCYPGFVGDDFYANKYIRIRDWYGAATDGKIYFKNDGRIMATEDVSTFQCNKFKALEGGITSDGQIYAYRNDVVADRNLIFGGRAISTLQSGESNLFAEGRQSAHGYGWHFANLNGQYSDIYAKIYHQQSDARTKIEIPKTLSLPENNESVLNKISKVTPKEFYYSEDKNKKIIYGFFAQELESQFPLAVNTSQYSKEDIESGNIIFPKDKNGEDIHDLKSIDPVAISAIMWDALKEVNAALEMQRIKNKELLDRIKVLEEKNK